jgi:hypothetical protein
VNTAVIPLVYRRGDGGNLSKSYLKEGNPLVSLFQISLREISSCPQADLPSEPFSVKMQVYIIDFLGSLLSLLLLARSLCSV